VLVLGLRAIWSNHTLTAVPLVGSVAALPNVRVLPPTEVDGEMLKTRVVATKLPVSPATGMMNNPGIPYVDPSDCVE